MERSDLKREVVSYITDMAEELALERVVLFGSRARGDFSDRSDIDLAVRGQRVRAYAALLEEECPTLLSFDVIDLSDNIADPLRKRIETERVILYEQA